MKVMIVEDNQQIVRVLEKYLQEDGAETVVVYDGGQALTVFETQSVDFVLLDIMLPNVDGFTICQQIRQQSTVPIIMITAKVEDADRILGLEIGADDYIIKPFSPKEVLSRMKAILRRIKFEKQKDTTEIRYGDFRLELAEGQAYYRQERLALTKKEFEILTLLAAHPQKIFSRDNLLDTVWGYDYYGDSRTVDSHIKRLRAKLSSAQVENCQIETVWGQGYRFEVQA